MYRIPLRVSNIDLEDDATLDILDSSLSDLEWSEVDGRANAVLYIQCDNPVGAAVEAARRISHAIPAAVVHEVDQDLVSISDIAHRIGINREGVRLWVEGKRGPGNFPPQIGSVGGGIGRGSTKVWPWSSVAIWLSEHYHIADDDQTLSPEQVAEVNAALLRVHEHIDAEWEVVTSYRSHLVQDSDRPGMHAVPSLPSSRTLAGLIAALQLVSPSRITLQYQRNTAPPRPGGDTHE
jgi:hypothetical protein